MTLGSRVVRPNHWRRKTGRPILLFLLAVWTFPSTSGALPTRLILALDGVAYRDVRALQEGVTRTNFWGKRIRRRAFTTEEGYFPVSRMVSTFPSISDVAWTDIFGDRPLNGYQRTYYSTEANRELAENSLSTSMEHERQMHWEVESGFMRVMGYLFPVHTFGYELHGLVKNFWQAGGGETNYYAYIRSSDDAQHLDCDIFSLLCKLDRQVQDLRARYRSREGHELQILILSDHGHNHAGRGQRVKVRDFLKKAGYRISETLVNPKDVVLPTVGIESWVEIHNWPAETETLMRQLTHLKGVDVLTAPAAGQSNRFLAMNGKGERAIIEWNPGRNTFRYATEEGDPLNYRPVIESLVRKKRLDGDGFATAGDWMEETMTHRYPLALERVVGGLTRVTLNPATILISLDNHYVNAGWLVEKGSRFVSCGSTHGGLDDLNSDGVLLNNFVATPDTSSSRVAKLFDNFPGLRSYRARENGAEWVSEKGQILTRIARTPFDRDCQLLATNDVFLRIWSPQFSVVNSKTPVEVTMKRIPRFSSAPIRRGTDKPMEAPVVRLTLNAPVCFPDRSAYERIYACPSNLVLEPQAAYRIWGRIQGRGRNIPLFEFTFHTTRCGRPAAF